MTSAILPLEYDILLLLKKYWFLEILENPEYYMDSDVISYLHYFEWPTRWRLLINQLRTMSISFYLCQQRNFLVINNVTDMERVNISWWNSRRSESLVWFAIVCLTQFLNILKWIKDRLSLFKQTCVNTEERASLKTTGPEHVIGPHSAPF